MGKLSNLAHLLSDAARCDGYSGARPKMLRSQPRSPHHVLEMGLWGAVVDGQELGPSLGLNKSLAHTRPSKFRFGLNLMNAELKHRFICP